MSLRGTLEDLSVIEVIQLPQRGRRTGLLSIQDGNERVELYYDSGDLVHASSSNAQGLDALIEIVDWSQGDFALDLGIRTEERSFDIDLHRAMMIALKARDEKRREEELRRNSSKKDRDSNMAASRTTMLIDKVKNFSSDSGYDCFIAFFEDNSDNFTIHRFGNKNQPLTEEQIELVTTFAKTYSLAKLKRLVIEDTEFTMVINTMEKSVTAIIASNDSLLGAVTRAATKLAEELEKVR